MGNPVLGKGKGILEGFFLTQNKWKASCTEMQNLVYCKYIQLLFAGTAASYIAFLCVCVLVFKSLYATLLSIKLLQRTAFSSSFYTEHVLLHTGHKQYYQILFINM